MLIKEIPQSGETRYFEIQTTKIIKDINDNDVEIKDTNKKVCLQELLEKKESALKTLQDIEAEYSVIEEFEKNNEKLEPIVKEEVKEEVAEGEIIEEEVVKEEIKENVKEIVK